VVRAESTGACASAAERRRVLLDVGLAVGFDDALTHVGDVGDVPDALLTGDASEVDRAIGKARRRLRRSGHPSAAAA